MIRKFNKQYTPSCDKKPEKLPRKFKMIQGSLYTFLGKESYPEIHEL